MRLLVLALATGCAATAPLAPSLAPLRSTTLAPAPPPPEGLHVRCRDRNFNCHEGVGLLARREGGDTQRCTVALVAPDRAITAAHCLRESERVEGASCAGTWLAFPATADRPLEWVACDRVLGAHAVDDEAVLRRDVAIVRLARPLDRAILAIVAEPPREGEVVTVLAVSPHPLYASQHELDPRLCRVASTERATEAFGAEAARVGWLVDCPSRPGSSGSPVVDSQGRLRALLHAGSAPGHGVAVTSSVAP